MSAILTRSQLLKRLGKPRLITLLSKVDPKLVTLVLDTDAPAEEQTATNAALEALDLILGDVTELIRFYIPVTDKTVCTAALIEFLVPLVVCALSRMSSTALTEAQADECKAAKEDLKAAKEAREKRDADPNTPATDRPTPQFVAGPDKIFTMDTMRGI